MNELETKARELKELQRMAEELNQEVITLQDEIKATITEQNTDTLTAGAFKITCKQVTSSKLDTKALKASNPEIADCFTKTTTTRRFVVA